MAGTTKEAKEITDGLNRFWEASPDVINAFKVMRKTICNDDGKGVINFKNKELIAIAVSVARKCKPCIISHLEVGIQAGITREELVEAVNIAILLCGGPGFAYAAYALEWYDDLVAGK